MNYQELERIFRAHEATCPKRHLDGLITFSDLGPYEDPSYTQRDRTYIVSAVSRTDGVGMPENMSDDAYGDMRFFVSPLIEGCNPALVNIISMDGVYTEFVQDGVLYRLTE